MPEPRCTCPSCERGERVAGHCFDIDDNLWHDCAANDEAPAELPDEDEHVPAPAPAAEPTGPRAFQCGTCSGTPDPNAKTLREWEAEAHARQMERHQPSARLRLADRLIDLVFCPTCLLPRFMPTHWFHGRTP